jgi:hypothetical protein
LGVNGSEEAVNEVPRQREKHTILIITTKNSNNNNTTKWQWKGKRVGYSQRKCNGLRKGTYITLCVVCVLDGEHLHVLFDPFPLGQMDNASLIERKEQ